MTANGTSPQPIDDREFYRVSDVSRLTGVKASVLRYWEAEFAMFEPIKSPSGQRVYSQQDINLVLKIKRLLYDEGFTIAGARRYLREPSAETNGSGRHHEDGEEIEIAVDNAKQLLSRKMLLDLRDSLRAFLTLLERR
ncbi:MAG: MerR family transcriptional regulator [Candidatus Acidiferrum sp.]